MIPSGYEPPGIKFESFDIADTEGAIFEKNDLHHNHNVVNSSGDGKVFKYCRNCKVEV